MRDGRHRAWLLLHVPSESTRQISSVHANMLSNHHQTQSTPPEGTRLAHQVVPHTTEAHQLQHVLALAHQPSVLRLVIPYKPS